MNKYFLLVILILSLWSCSPAHRLNSLLKNHPELTITDTIKKVDTFVTKEHKLDTSFIDRFNTVTDTFTVNNSHETIRYSRVHDTVHVACDCKQDTIIKTVNTVIHSTKHVVIQGISSLKKVGLCLLGLFLLILGLIIGKIIK